MRGLPIATPPIIERVAVVPVIINLTTIIMILSQLMPVVNSTKMFSSNLADPDKQLVISFNGEKFTLSKKLTEDFRAERVSIAQLGDYEVRDVEGADGTTFKSLGYSGEDITVNGVTWKASPATKKTFTAEEFTLKSAVAFEALA